MPTTTRVRTTRNSLTVPTRTSPRTRKLNVKASLKVSTPSKMTTRLSIRRPARVRKSRRVYSPSVLTTRKNRTRLSKVKLSCDVDQNPFRRLEGRIRGHVKQMKYYEAFLEAYEAEGWRRASMEKIKPTRELLIARTKLLKAKRGILTTLQELDVMKQKDPQISYLKELEEMPNDETCSIDSHKILCSRCASTITTEDNDILLCDYEGCYRAYHQRCQVIVVPTEEIPEGDEPWYCLACLAIFNSLKCINYAFGTTYESITDVFSNLVCEEETGAVLPTSKEEGIYMSVKNVVDAENEDDDEDFDGDSGSSSDNDDDDVDLGSSEEEISDDELCHLSRDDVIDLNRRTTRSVITSKRVRGMSNVIGSKRVPRDSVPVESKATDDLILHSKRKRKHVDYRVLNDLLFGGQADSDDEHGDSKAQLYHPPNDHNDDDENPHNVTDCEEEEVFISTTSTQPRQQEDKIEVYMSKRTRRTRKVVDYRAMHEGVIC